jgi:hypothetical protein
VPAWEGVCRIFASHMRAHGCGVCVQASECVCKVVALCACCVLLCVCVCIACTHKQIRVRACVQRRASVHADARKCDCETFQCWTSKHLQGTTPDSLPLISRLVLPLTPQKVSAIMEEMADQQFKQMLLAYTLLMLKDRAIKARHTHAHTRTHTHRAHGCCRAVSPAEQYCLLAIALACCLGASAEPTGTHPPGALPTTKPDVLAAQLPPETCTSRGPLDQPPAAARCL